MNLKRSSASRGELTKAMSATLREVRMHHEQIAALLAGMQQLMDGQAALGEAFETLKTEQGAQIAAIIDEVERLMAETSALREGVRELEPVRA